MGTFAYWAAFAQGTAGQGLPSECELVYDRFDFAALESDCHESLKQCCLLSALATREEDVVKHDLLALRLLPPVRVPLPSSEFGEDFPLLPGQFISLHTLLPLSLEFF